MTTEENISNIPFEELMPMLEDCKETLTVSNCPFTAWEKEFLKDIVSRHSNYGIKATFTGRQKYYIKRAWEKI